MFKWVKSNFHKLIWSAANSYPVVSSKLLTKSSTSFNWWNIFFKWLLLASVGYVFWMRHRPVGVDYTPWLSILRKGRNNFSYRKGDKTSVNSSLCVLPSSSRCNILNTKCNDANWSKTLQLLSLSNFPFYNNFCL